MLRSREKEVSDLSSSAILYTTIDYEDDEAVEKDEAEQELEKLVLGGDIKFSKLIKKKEKKKRKHLENLPSINEIPTEDIIPQKKPAWTDEDDVHLLVKEKADTLKKPSYEMKKRREEQYSEHLKSQYVKLMGVPKWAKPKDERSDESDDDEEDHDEFLRKTGKFVKQSSFLPQNKLDFRRCTDLNNPAKEHAILKSVEFHPKSPVALTAGYSGTVGIFQVDGKVNTKIQSVHFEKFPIYKAHFTVTGEEILAGSSEYNHFYCYDMLAGKSMKIPWSKHLEHCTMKNFHLTPDGKFIIVCGRFGNIYVLNSKSKEWVATLKMNDYAKAIAFSPDGSVMYSHGSSEVYIWNLNSRRCMHRFNDLGCLSGTALAVSPNNQYLTTGSDCGIISIYEIASLLNGRNPKPIKEVMNLVTEVHQIKFNSTSELLAAASYMKADSVKLVHFPSMTVFPNFPGANKLKHINTLDISPNSGYITLGNNTGIAHLFRLRHFSNY